MLIGNITRDPEVRTTPSGSQVASFSIATNYVWKDASGQAQKKAEFHNIVAWTKLAEICGQYLKKGMKVYVEGRLQTREYQATDGTKKQRTEIVASDMIMLDRAGAPSGGGYAPAQNQASNNLQNNDYGAGSVSEDDIRIESIPF